MAAPSRFSRSTPDVHERTHNSTCPTACVHIIEVSPEIAQRWLRRNTHNRSVSDAQVEKYARDMRSGRWHLNNDIICFDTNDNLLNGQHRLKGVVRADVTVPMQVGFNYPPQAQDTMDIHRKRTVGNQLELHGEHQTNQLAAILRLAVAYELGYRAIKTFKPSDQEMHAYLAAHPEIRQAVEVASRARKFVPYSPSVIGFAYYVCARIDAYAAEVFFVQQLIGGIDLHVDDPARALHRRFTEARSTKRAVNVDEALRWIFYAWNAFRDKRPVSKLTGPKGGWTAENFPEPK